jgi:hypothetical protein
MGIEDGGDALLLQFGLTGDMRCDFIRRIAVEGDSSGFEGLESFSRRWSRGDMCSKLGLTGRHRSEGRRKDLLP